MEVSIRIHIDPHIDYVRFRMFMPFISQYTAKDKKIHSDITKTRKPISEVPKEKKHL